MSRWYYSDAGEVVGPFTEQRLYDLQGAGIISGETLVWSEGRDEWLSLSQLRAPIRPPPLLPSIPPTPSASVATSVRARIVPRGLAWRRFGARLLDTYIHSTAGAIIVFLPWGFLAPESAEAVVRVLEQPEGKIISIIVGTFLALFVGAGVLASVGTTFGKLLFGVWISTPAGRRPGPWDAVEREFGVWLKGMAMGVPFISLFANMAGFNRLTQRGATSWDEGRFEVTYRPPSKAQTSLNVLGAILCLLAIALAMAPG